MAARAAAAARNVCTSLVKYFDLEQYTKASPEMKSAIQALENVRAGGCKCGNARPKQRFMGCGLHLSCEECHLDFTKVANRKGGCNFPGCNCQVLWPCRPVQAFDQVQEAASEAFQRLDHALQIEEQKDVGEGARRRAAALGREEPELDDEDDDVPLSQLAARLSPKPVDEVMSEAGSVEEPAGGVPADLAPPPAARKNKRKADFSEEEWVERRELAKARKHSRAQDAQLIAEHPLLEAEIERLQGLLDANCIAY
jgi:hypothetical protein